MSEYLQFGSFHCIHECCEIQSYRATNIQVTKIYFLMVLLITLIEIASENNERVCREKLLFAVHLI